MAVGQAWYQRHFSLSSGVLKQPVLRFPLLIGVPESSPAEDDGELGTVGLTDVAPAPQTTTLAIRGLI